MFGTTNLRRRITGGVAVLAFVAAVVGAIRPVAAHETKCPYCKLDVVQDTPTLDNEVALRYGRKRIEYRCVFCALAEAKTKYSGDLTILAPSETKGKYVVISRKGGAWSAAPDGAVFIGEKVNHKHCQTGYRALTSRDAFDAYIKKNRAIVGDAKPLTLAQMVELAK